MATIDPMAQLFDPELMSQYRALLEPPPEAKRQAGMDALLALGLGLLGNRSPYFGVALGNAGAGAMGAHRYALDTARQNRMGEIQGAMGLRKLSKDINQEQARDKAFNDWLATQPVEKQAAARAAYLGAPESWAKFMAEQQFPKPTEFQQETAPLSPDEQRNALLMRHNLVPKPVLPTFTEGAWVDPNKLSYTPVPEAQQFKLTQSAMSAPRLTNVQYGERKATEAFAKQDAEAAGAAQKVAADMRKLLPKIDRMIMLSKEGQTYSGWAAGARTDLANIADFFKIPVDREKLANSEEYFAQNAELVRQQLKAIGGNDSNTDLLFSQRSSADLSRSVQGRKQILRALRDDIANSVEEANRLSTEVRGAWNVPTQPRLLKPVAPLNVEKPPVVGEVRDGYRFKGGNPNDRNSWEATK